MELNQGTGNMSKKGQTGTKREHTCDSTLPSRKACPAAWKYHQGGGAGAGTGLRQGEPPGQIKELRRPWRSRTLGRPWQSRELRRQRRNRELGRPRRSRELRWPWRIWSQTTPTTHKILGGAYGLNWRSRALPGLNGGSRALPGLNGGSGALPGLNWGSGALPGLNSGSGALAGLNWESGNAYENLENLALEGAMEEQAQQGAFEKLAQEGALEEQAEQSTFEELALRGRSLHWTLVRGQSLWLFNYY